MDDPRMDLNTNDVQKTNIGLDVGSPLARQFK
jgi:hypothetical protein